MVRNGQMHATVLCPQISHHSMGRFGVSRKKPNAGWWLRCGPNIRMDGAIPRTVTLVSYVAYESAMPGVHERTNVAEYAERQPGPFFLSLGIASQGQKNRQYTLRTVVPIAKLGKLIVVQVTGAAVHMGHHGVNAATNTTSTIGVGWGELDNVELEPGVHDLRYSFPCSLPPSRTVFVVSEFYTRKATPRWPGVSLP